MDEEEQYFPIYRTDGFWYMNAYKVLSKFANKLKIEILSTQRDLPFDIQTALLSTVDEESQCYKCMQEKIQLLREYNRFINLELRARLAALRIQYDESDTYVNVINYAKANGLNVLDDTVLLNEVLPWLGTTDWSSNTGGRSEQMRKIKDSIKSMSKGGKKSKRKASTKKVRKSNKNIKRAMRF
jgi:hypothetical protein